jgi:hypothetical protein
MPRLIPSITATLLCALCLLGLSTALAADNSGLPNGSIQGRLVAIPNAMRLVRTPPRGVPRARIFLTAAATGKLLQQTLTGSDGSFDFSVPPGSYLLMSPTAKAVVHVASGQTTPVVLRQIAR